MPQVETYKARLEKVQAAMKEFGLRAMVLESGPAMQYVTGVRWGRSERTFAVVITQTGDPVYVLPGFEEQRARELIDNHPLRVGQPVQFPVGDSVIHAIATPGKRLLLSSDKNLEIRPSEGNS